MSIFSQDRPDADPSRPSSEEHLPNLDQFLDRASALELARRSLLGAPVYSAISLIMLIGTPVLTQYGAWVWLEAGLLVLLGVIRVLYALGFERHYARYGEKAVLQFSVLAALHSLALGSLAAIVICNYWATQETVLTIVLSAGCVAAGTSAMSVRNSAKYIFLACVLLPLGIAVYLVGGAAKALLIVGFLLLMAILVQDGGEARRCYLQKLKDHYEGQVIRRRVAIENQAKKRYLAGIANEIRSPVYSIIGMSGLLSSEPMSDAGLAYLHTLRDACQALLRLVSNIPGAVKVATYSERQEACLAPVNLRRVIRRISELYRVEAIGRGLEFRLQLEDLPESILFAEEAKLEQVLANLLANAVNYTDQGSIIVSASSESMHDGGLRIELAISDTGMGIPPQLQATLFKPFSVNGIRDSACFHGAGFGLPMCKDLVSSMGGNLQLESQEGRGTRVSFTLLAQPDETTDVRDSPEEMRWLAGESSGPVANLSVDYPHDILVVDDDDVHRHILIVYLAKCGYRPDQAGDGQQAIDALMNKGYDLVFMDLSMPAMDGLEATRWIREHFDRHKWRLHIVALTADTSMETRYQSLSAGIDNFLSKPVLGNELNWILTRRRVPAV